MRAIKQTGYGQPERVLQLAEADKPTPGERQVLVRVLASSINSGDWRRVYASPILVRIVSGLRRPKNPWALGGDICGVVEEVGPGAVDLAVGDEVFGIRSGAFAEYVAGESFVRKPTNLTFDQAATVPIAGVTALQALQKHGNLRAGEHVVVNGAGGGVGSFAVQIAKALGAEVTAVTSTDKVELMRTLGADHVVDYTREDFTKSAGKYDLIIDVAGNRPIRALKRVMAPSGRMVLPGAGRGRLGVLGRLIGGGIRSKLGQPVKFYIASGPYQEQLATLREMIESGKVAPVIDRTFALSDVADAIRYGATEKTKGKVVLTVAQP